MSGQLCVAVMQLKAGTKKSAIDIVDRIASHLHHPFFSGMLSDPGERYPSRF